MRELVYILGSTVLISLFSLAGVALMALGIKGKKLDQIIFYLVAIAAGTMLGGAFFHLLPEAAHKLEPEPLYLVVAGSFVLYFLLEKLIFWHHCHKQHCEVHPVSYLNLIGDSVHNFIDGLILASAYLIDIKLGLITTAAVALHEIPQEIGDFGVLIYAGFTRRKALLMNLLVGLVAVLGGLAGFAAARLAAGIVVYLLPLAAGGFLYIAMSDLIPEIRAEKRLGKSLKIFSFFVLGLVVMYALKFLEVK